MKVQGIFHRCSVCVCVFLVLEVRPEVCVLCWNETLCFWPDSSDRRSVWTVTSWERVFGGLQIKSNLAWTMGSAGSVPC